MTPPQKTNVIDRNGGFTAVTGVTKSFLERYARAGRTKAEAILAGPTLWRPGSILKKTTDGVLLAYDERSFYQTNDDVTKAIYKVPGYAFVVAVWFDNATGERIA